jgi:hypothetical protein
MCKHYLVIATCPLHSTQAVPLVLAKPDPKQGGANEAF